MKKLYRLPDGAWVDYRNITSIRPEPAGNNYKDEPIKPRLIVSVTEHADGVFSFSSGRRTTTTVHYCETEDEARRVADELAELVNGVAAS